MLLAAMLGFFLAGAYYHRRFGRVEPRWGPLWGCLGALVGFGLYIACAALDEHQHRLSFSSVFMACLSLACYIGSKGRRWHYLPLALMFVGLAVLPLTGMVSPEEIGSGPGSLLTQALGLFFVVGGLLDHRLLCRMLAAPAAMEAPSD
jgi:drug/metabolite transporter (DMT)-like permease